MAKPKNPKPTKGFSGHGQKSKPWRDDPEILRRLAQVEDLVLAGYRNTEVAKALSVTEATIRRDRERCAALWRDQTSNHIVSNRLRSIANYQRIMRQADNEFRHAEQRGMLDQRPALLRLQLEAERQITSLQGTVMPVKQQMDIPGLTDTVKSLSTNDMLSRADALEALAKKLLGQLEDDPQTESDGLDGDELGE